MNSNVKHGLAATALAIFLAGPAVTQAATKPTVQSAVQQELQQMREMMESMNGRLQKLETKNAELESQNAALREQAAAATSVKADIEQLQKDADATSEQLAKTKAGVPEWAGRYTLKGDLRYRNETIETENNSGVNVADRARDRIRLRVGVDAKVSDTVKVGLQLATGDDGDPRSTNATLSDANQRKSIRVDQAYIDWAGFTNTTLTLGKQKQPWFRPGYSLFYDGDVNPEGLAIKYASPSGVFANAWGYWLREVSTKSDSSVTGAQVGYKAPALGLTVAASYSNYGTIKDNVILPFNGSSSNPNGDSPAGNSTYSANSTCSGPAPAPPAAATTCYLYDYNIIQLSAQWDWKIGNLPIMAFGDYIKNQAADDLDTGWTVGVLLGKASNPRTWEIGALYEKMEKDAQFGAFLDSDFAGGTTQGKGWVGRVAYVPMKNVTLNAQFFYNQRDFDTAVEKDYRRLQLDMNFKF